MFSYSSKNWLRLSSFRDFESAMRLRLREEDENVRAIDQH